MTDSNECKSENRKLTATEWSSLWAETHECAFSVARGQQHLNLLLATSCVVNECLVEGVSFQQFQQRIESLKFLHQSQNRGCVK